MVFPLPLQKEEGEIKTAVLGLLSDHPKDHDDFKDVGMIECGIDSVKQFLGLDKDVRTPQHT